MKTTTRKLIILALLLFLKPISVLSQLDYLFNTITVDKGLSSGDITSITQDSDGFIWFGTIDGLNRYDGYDIRKFQYIRGDTTSLPHPSIKALHSAADGQICIIANTKLCKYIPEKEHFQQLQFQNSSIQVFCLTSDLSGNLWLGTSDGIYSCEKNLTLVKKFFTGIKEIDGRSISSIFIDSSNDFWMEIDGNIVYFDRLNKKNKTFEFFKGKSKFSICEGSKGQIWIGTFRDGIYLINKSNSSVTAITDKKDFSHLICLYKDKNGIIYAGVMDGFVKFGKNSLSYKLYKEDKNVDFTQLRTTVNAIFIDNQENLWLGHSKLGVSHTFGKKGFSYITQSNDSKISLHNKEVSALLIDSKNILWVGYWCGNIDRIDRRNNTIRHIHTNDVGLTYYSGTIFSIFEDSKGRIWFGSYEGGLQQYNELTGSFDLIKKSTPGKAGNLGSNHIRSICEDDRGRLWLSVMGAGIDIYNPETGIIKNIQYVPNEMNSLTGNWVFSIYKGNGGEMWIGSTDGVTVIDKNDKVIHKIKANATDTSSLISNNIQVIYNDKSGNIWIGTNQGLCRYIPESQTFKIITMQNGLPGNSINIILEDKTGNLWIATNNGITRYDHKKNNFRNYSVHDGLLGNEFMPGSGSVAADGEMFFGSLKGINIFHPDKIMDAVHPSPAYITEFQLFNKKISVGESYNGRVLYDKPIYKTGEIFLKHTERIITLSFASLNYGIVNKTTYTYSLVNDFDKAEVWHNTGNLNRVTFDLPVGRHVFKVKASYDNHTWSNPSELVINIRPPYWKTTWFKVSLIVLIIFAIVLIILWRSSNLKKRTIELEEKVNERTSELYIANQKLEEKQINILNQASELKIQTQKLQEMNNTLEVQKESLNELVATKDKLFSIIAHDLRSPFNALLGFSELLFKKIEVNSLEKNKSYIRIIINSLKMTLNLLENLLQWSSAQRGVIEFEPREINLIEATESNIDFYLQFALQKGIVINFSYNGTPQLVWGDINMIDTIIRNLLANAVKYSYRDGKIEIWLDFEEQFTTFNIQDNGPGIPDKIKDKLFISESVLSENGTEGEKGTGLGLLISVDFVKRHNGEIFVKTELGKGSTFSFKLYNKPFQTKGF